MRRNAVIGQGISNKSSAFHLIDGPNILLCSMLYSLAIIEAGPSEEAACKTLERIPVGLINRVGTSNDFSMSFGFTVMTLIQ